MMHRGLEAQDATTSSEKIHHLGGPTERERRDPDSTATPKHLLVPSWRMVTKGEPRYGPEQRAMLEQPRQRDLKATATRSSSSPPHRRRSCARRKRRLRTSDTGRGARRDCERVMPRGKRERRLGGSGASLRNCLLNVVLLLPYPPATLPVASG